MRFSLCKEALGWAFSAWRKHSIAWALLWFIFLVTSIFYGITALVLGVVSPLLGILVYVIGCLLPSYIYGAFIKAGLQQHDHPLQVIEKRFFSYFSIGAAFDICIGKILFCIILLGLGCCMFPFYYMLSYSLPEEILVFLFGSICIYIASVLLYFYPYAIVDVHQKNALKMTFLYTYYNALYCCSMTILWFLALLLTVFTFGIAGFFLFPLLTLADVYVYKKLKVKIPE